MERYGELREENGLRTRAITYEYRSCPSCRRELPSRQKSCPQCAHWLGEEPRRRTEWQLVPAAADHIRWQRYELVAASALIVRLVCAHAPTEDQIAQLAKVIEDISSATDHAVCRISGQGWLLWTAAGVRSAFRQGREIEQRINAFLPRLKHILFHSGEVRWGIWIDQYLVPFGAAGTPAIDAAAAKAIFNFEPDNVMLVSEAVYRDNRRWEHFVCVPRRLLDGDERYGYLMTGHKRPSALDHAQVARSTVFIGRERELSTIEDFCGHGERTTNLAIIAPAGSGKTRLIAEWLARHPDIRSLTANFSLFGGGIESFAGQLAELPAERLDENTLSEAILNRLHNEQIKALILDDLHWAGPGDISFLRHLIAVLPPGMILVLASRPSGQHLIETLAPTMQLALQPLSAQAVEEVARRLTNAAAVGKTAALRSNGSPLFVEQFVAWASEANFAGGDDDGPRNLHQVIAARIAHLLKNRVGDIRQRWQWGGSWQRQLIIDELAELEREIGLWLDRLETGDYADRVEAASHLSELERLEYEVFLLSIVAGRARPRSSRLRESIERLLVGSADQILTDLRRRAAAATGTDKENVAREARHAGDVLYDANDWRLAGAFYQLAQVGTLWEEQKIACRIAQCRRHSQATITNDSEVYAAGQGQNLDDQPNVDSPELPYVWAELGRRFHVAAYFVRAGEAAKALNDPALAVWAERKAEALRAKRVGAARSAP